MKLRPHLDRIAKKKFTALTLYSAARAAGMTNSTAALMSGISVATAWRLGRS